MNSIFSYSNYREYFRVLVYERKQRGQKKVELATIMGCQAAYLSQVLNGKVEFTEDHILRLCRALSFNDLETDYLLILLRLSKAGSLELREYLEDRRVKLKNLSSELEDRLSSTKKRGGDECSIYYASSWIPSVIHLATSCDHLKTAEGIAKQFRIDQKMVSDHLRQLEKYNLVKFENEQWHFVGSSFHFPKDSLIDLQMQFSRRLLAMDRLIMKRKDDLHYSVVFSADEETFQKLRSHFLNSIEYIHKTIEPVPGKSVQSIALDVFRV